MKGPMQRVRPQSPVLAPLPEEVPLRPNADLSEMQKQLGEGGAIGVVVDFEHRMPPLRPASSETANYQIGQIVDVALQSIDVHELNARVYYSTNDIDAMALSLSRNGQNVPARGYVDVGRVVLIDGQKRLRAARAGGLPTLRVEICQKPASPLEVYFESRRINVERSTQTVLDDALRFSKLIGDRLVPSQAALAEELSISESALSKVLAINAIPERIRLLMKDRPHTCGQTIAYAVAQIFTSGRDLVGDVDKLEQIAAEVVTEIAEKELPSKQAQALIASRIAGPRKRTTPTSENLRYGSAKGILKMFPTKGEISLHVKDLTPEQVQELSENIKSFFSEKKAS